LVPVHRASVTQPRVFAALQARIALPEQAPAFLAAHLIHRLPQVLRHRKAIKGDPVIGFGERVPGPRMYAGHRSMHRL